MTLERAQLALLAATAAALPVSIFAGGILLSLSIGVLVARLVRHETTLERTPVDTPLLAFAVWTLLSASFAANPLRSHQDAKKLLLFALFYLGVEVMARGENRERVLSAALLGGLALAALMLAQHLFLGFDRLDRRPHGFLGHYMTASGVTMVVLLLSAARLLFGRLPRPRVRDLWLPGLVLLGVTLVATLDATPQATHATWLFVAALVLGAAWLALAGGATARAAEATLPVVVAPLAAWALVVSQTRGVWIGAVVGLAAIAALRTPRLLAVVAAGVVLVIAVRPAALSGRLTLGDASSIDRYYMWQAGLDMVLDRPVFGQGPGMILSSYPRYRWPEAPNAQQPHLHNNLLQLAAERGVPGLAFFLWWAVATTLAALVEARRGRTLAPLEPATAAAVGTLGVLAAVFAAGLFEYNLGDSEVLMLVLLVTAVPFALSRARAAVPAP